MLGTLQRKRMTLMLQHMLQCHSKKRCNGRCNAIYVTINGAPRRHGSYRISLQQITWFMVEYVAVQGECGSVSVYVRVDTHCVSAKSINFCVSLHM